MKYQLDENQSYDIDELSQLITNAISGHGESCLVVHGDISSPVQIIIDNHINAMTLEQRQAKNLDDVFNAAVDDELSSIDLASIRSIREYIASKPDAPQWLKDQENAAAAARATRKP